MKNLSPEEVEASGVETPRKFLVQWIELGSPDQKLYDTFDIVIVCTGHESCPNYPEIQGREEWDGRALHTINYRNASKELFDQKIVVIYGKSVFAQEIMANILIDKFEEAMPTKIIWAGGRSKFFDLSKNEFYKKFVSEGILEITTDPIVNMKAGKVCTFKSESGEEREVEVDTVLWATGYKFNYPFLKEEDNLFSITEKGKYMTPMFHALWCINEPDLILQGIHSQNLFMHQYAQWQGKTIANYISGHLTLPSQEDMRAWLTKYEKDWLEQGFKLGDIFYFNYYTGYTPFTYGDELNNLNNLDIKRETRYDIALPGIQYRVAQLKTGDYINYKYGAPPQELIDNMIAFVSQEEPTSPQF